jgi:hypothetical protein
VLRALSTADVDTVCTVVNLASQALDRDYAEPVRRRLQRAFGGLDSRELRAGYMVLANNLDEAVEYCARLRQEVADAVPAALAPTATQQQQLEAALSLLADTHEALQASAEVTRLSCGAALARRVRTHTPRPCFLGRRRWRRSLSARGGRTCGKY